MAPKPTWYTEEYQEMSDKLGRIQTLVTSGILGKELCPESNYWHWQILKPELLPTEFQHFIEIGEVRW